MRRLFSCFAALALAAGCAKTSSGGSDGGGGSGAGSDTSCAGNEDEPGAPILVRFTNATAAEIYLWTPCNVVTRPTFSLYRDGSEVRLDRYECVGTCGEAQTANEPYCPSFDCEDQGLLLRIERDRTYELDWLASEQVRSEMSASCYHESKAAQAECWRQIDLPEATYLATGTYIPKSSVTQSTTGEPGCGCQVSLTQPGVCQINPDNCVVSTGDQPLPEVTVDLPSGVIEFVITD